MSNTPKTNLPRLATGQANAEVIHNEALNRLDTFTQLSVKDRDLSTPPGSPAEGDTYLVATSPTGDWTGHAGDVAMYYSGWLFATPREGWVAWVDDEDVLIYFSGSAWFTLPASPTGGTYVTTLVNRYISPTGSDVTGDGSSGNPWQTLEHALSETSSYWITDTGTLRINVAAGAYSYTAMTQVTALASTHGNGKIEILGDTQNPENHRFTALVNSDELTISDFAVTGGSTVITFSGSPDLSTVIDGTSIIFIQGYTTDPDNNGFFTVTAHNDTAKTVTITTPSGASDSTETAYAGITKNVDALVEVFSPHREYLEFRGVTFEGAQADDETGGGIRCKASTLCMDSCLVRYNIRGVAVLCQGIVRVIDSDVENNKIGLYAYALGLLEASDSGNAGTNYDYGAVADANGVANRGAITGDTPGLETNGGIVLP